MPSELCLLYDVITSGREAPLSTLLFVLRNGRFPLVRERVNVITVRNFFVLGRIGMVALLHARKSKSPITEQVVLSLLKTWQRLTGRGMY